MTTSPRPYCTEQRPSGRKTLRGPCLGGTGAEQDRVRGHSLACMPPLQSCPREGSGPHGTRGWESRVPMSLPGLPGWMEGAAVCVSGMDGGGCNVCVWGGGEGTDVWGRRKLAFHALCPGWGPLTSSRAGQVTSQVPDTPDISASGPASPSVLCRKLRVTGKHEGAPGWSRGRAESLRFREGAARAEVGKGAKLQENPVRKRFPLVFRKH